MDLKELQKNPQALMIGGAAVGVAIDWLVGRGSHWGLMVMLFLGIVVAFRNIIRISNRPSE